MSTEEVRRSKNKGIEPIPVHERIPKRWVTAKRKNGARQKLTNETIEGQYHRVLAKAKQLLKGQRGLYFERDYKHDDRENAFTLHAFLSNSFYLYLECNFRFIYQVEYAFSNCQYEAEIRILLSSYTLSENSKEVELQPIFNTYYGTVISIQEQCYVHSL